MQLSRVSQHANSDVAANQHAEALDYQGELFYSETMRQMFQGGKKERDRNRGLSLVHSQETFSLNTGEPSFGLEFSTLVTGPPWR